MLGGSIRLSASDAALVAMSVGQRSSPLRSRMRPRTRDPILGRVPEVEQPRAQTTGPTETIFRHGSREFAFPARGSIASIGDPFESTQKRPSRRKANLECVPRRAVAAARPAAVTSRIVCDLVWPRSALLQVRTVAGDAEARNGGGAASYCHRAWPLAAAMAG